MRFQSYFNTAVKIINLYDGAIPLAHFLKQYFSNNKKHGSQDRKFISHASYNYCRIGFLLEDLAVEERLKIAIFLCNEKPGEWKILYDDKWLKHWSDSLNERIAFTETVYPSFNLNKLFPFTGSLSDAVDINAFIQSHLIQPDVFLRIRPYQHEKVIHALTENNFSFAEDDDCITLKNANKIEQVIKIDEEAVIQDYSSQRIREFLITVKQEAENSNQKINLWDCCAGSGGKSILVYDVLGKINLTVSDVRTSIIHNLKKRFTKAGIKNYKAVVTDIINNKLQISNSGFHLIICDAPCTGSGTWSRTPEQLCFFKEEKIENYSALQKNIASNAIISLEKDGYFLYITCSVFKKENEEAVEFLKRKFNLQLMKTALLKGYSKKADTLFAALFKK